MCELQESVKLSLGIAVVIMVVGVLTLAVLCIRGHNTRSAYGAIVVLAFLIIVCSVLIGSTGMVGTATFVMVVNIVLFALSQ